MSYHNTCGIEDTADYQRKALTQDELILAFFRLPFWDRVRIEKATFPDRRTFNELFSPSDLNAMVLPDALLTSVRRALSNLTKAERLVKTDMLVDGLYGRPEGLWKLAEPVQGKLL